MSIFTKIKRFVRPRPLSCEEVNRFIMDFLDGEVDERTEVRFEAHLRNCPNCEAFLDQYRNTVHLVKDRDNVQIPDELVRRTIDFLQDHYDEE